MPLTVEKQQRTVPITAKKAPPQPMLPADRPKAVHPLLWILLAGAIVRAALWISWSSWTPLVNDDARDYQGLATRLATTGQYVDQHGQPISLRPPLYPAIVAATYLGFGLENDDAVRAMQACVGLLTVVLVYRLGVITYSRWVAVWAASIVCFYPSLLGYANMLLSETIFTFFVVAFTWLICEAYHREQLAMLVAAGVAMGLAALTRSIVLLFAPIVSCCVLLGWPGNWGRRLLAAALPLAVFAVVIVPWAVRNTRLQKTMTFIDVMGGRNAMMGNYEFTPLEHSWATISLVPEEHAWDRILHRERTSDAPLTQGQIDKLALRHAIHFVWTHPWLTVQRDVVKFFNFWQLDRLLLAAAGMDYFGNLSRSSLILLAVVVCGSYALVLLAAIFGICCAVPHDRRLHWFLLAGILFPCAIHTLIFAHSRYLLPQIPLLALYSAAAIVYRHEIVELRHSWRFRLAAFLSIVVVFGWLRELVFADASIIGKMFS